MSLGLMEMTNQILADIPKIAPINDDHIDKPLWSVMIPTYNCARSLHKTLASVLMQDPGSHIMQIAVVDNCSTQDDPEAVVTEVGKGRIEFYRNPHNLGSTSNFNRCIELSNGRLIHILHGDDYVFEGFYCKLQSIFELHPQIGAAFCRSMHVDESGKVLYVWDLELSKSGVLNNTWLQKIATRFCVPAPAMVVRREVYENLGGYNSQLVGADDWEMWVRIANQYPIGYETTCLAAYCQHSNSLSNALLSSKRLLQEHYEAIRMMQTYLPNQIKYRVFRQAKQNIVLYNLDLIGVNRISPQNWTQFFEIAKITIYISPSLRVVLKVARILLLNIIQSILIVKDKE
jgi:glycosyltransferase involved in cell wall biosynthesis